MRKRIVVFAVFVFCFFAFLINVKALNKIYFDSEDLSIMPGETKEIGVFVDCDNSFTTVKMNVITTSSSINFAGITYNDAFTRTNSGNGVVLTSKTSLKSGTKVATIKVKASDSASVGVAGYIRVSNALVDDTNIENASLSVKVSNESTNNTYLKSITSNIIKIDFNKDTYDYEYDVSSDVDKMDLVAQAQDSSSTVEISDQTLKTGKNEIKITVTSKTKEKKVYTVVINKKAKEEVKITSNDDVTLVSSNTKTKKPNKTGFLALLGLLTFVLVIDLIVMKNKKNTK